MSALTWNPTIDFVRKTLASEKKLRLIVSPFIKFDALRELIDECEDTSELQVVVRWLAEDLVAGVSDVEIYPYLKNREIALFRHPSIHLKLYVYNHSLAFHTSGNVTKKGLGLTPNANVEIGCPVTLEENDWRNLLNLLATSEEIDDKMYEQALKYTAENKHQTKKLPPLILTPSTKKDFTLASLPASEDPRQLYHFYTSELDPQTTEAGAAEFVHDLMLYSLPSGLGEDEFFLKLEENFRKNTFTKSLANFVRKSGSARFGAIKTWIKQQCSDTPRPYRRDLQVVTRHLYNWLSHFYDEISWDVPNHSMIIYWTPKTHQIGKVEKE
jgi:hypothetical protein